MTDQKHNGPAWNAVTLIVLLVFYMMILSCLLAIILNGAGALEGEHDNKFRAFCELLSFVSTAFLVPAAAFWAISFARKQAAEAERSRLASVYLEITKRWVDADLASSRRLLQRAKQKFRMAANEDFSGQAITETLPGGVAEYVCHCLVQLREKDLSSFGQYVRILTFFEDLGVLCRQGYVNKDVILDFIGQTIIEIVDLTALYIKVARRRHSPDGAPDEAVYANLIWLYRQAQEFEAAQIYVESDEVLTRTTTA